MTFLRNKNSIYVGLGSITAISSLYLCNSYVLKLGSLNINNLLQPNNKSSKNEDDYIYLPDELADSYYDLPYKNESNIVHETNTHWKLLWLAQHSKNQNIKKLALKTLASNTFSDFQYQELSQVCDFKTSLLLAKIPNVNLKLFKPLIKPNFINLPCESSNSNSHNFDLDEVLAYLLSEASSQSNCPDCTKYFTNIALTNLLSKKNLHDLPDNEEILRLRSNENKIYWVCLQALLQCSSCGQQECESLVQNGLFLVLNFFKNKSPDTKIDTCLAQILCNVSMHKNLHIHFWQTGWIRILVQWLNSNNIELSFPASKILFNLNMYNNNSNNSFLDDSLYILHPLYNEHRESKFDVIFVHGLLGGVLRTWRQCDTEKLSTDYTRCWPKYWLANDLDNARILGVNYQTYLSDWNFECPNEKITLKDRSVQMLNNLLNGKVGEKPIIWVAHSMGGLLVKQILIDSHESENPTAKKILNQTRGIVFYSVPHKGSEMAVWSPRMQRIILPSTEVLELRKDSHYLVDLHEKFRQIAKNKNIKCLSFGEKLKSKVGLKSIKWKAHLVPEETANPEIGEFVILPVDHYNTCKPENKSSLAYASVLKFIKQIIDNHSKKNIDDYPATLISLIY